MDSDICDFRRVHRTKCRVNIYRHRMAVRYQDGLLFGWVVVKPAILLLGDRER
jgi:hypothetical protein